MGFSPGFKTSTYKYTRSYKRTQRRKIFLGITFVCALVVSLLALNREQQAPFILPPNPDHTLDKIIARLNPQISTPLSSSILPASFVTESFLFKRDLKELLSINPIQKFTIKSSSELSVFWEEILGADPLETTLVVQAAKAVTKSTVIPANSIVAVKLDNDSNPNSISWRVNPTEKIEITRASSNRFSANVFSDLPTVQQRVASGTIYSSLIDSAKRSDLSYNIVDEFVDLLGDRVDFRKDLRVGDAFAVVLTQEKYSDGTWGKPIELIGASLMNKGKIKAAVKIKNASGKFQSFNEEGQPIGDQFLQYPVKFSRVSSVFNDSRLHPVLKIKRPHNGVDFAAPTGTPVRSVGDGIIEKAGYFGAAGNMIKISHSKRWSTAYLHLSKIDRAIKPGARVSKGQLIGAVGSTGLSSGPHLHFSLYDNNRYVDPLKTKLPGVVNEKDLPSQQIILASLEPLKKELEVTVLAYAVQNGTTKKG